MIRIPTFGPNVTQCSDPIEYSWHSTPQLWCATRRSYDGAPDSSSPIGFGKTKPEAIAELLEWEELRAA